MKIEEQERLDTYLQLVEAVEARTGDRQVAVAVLAEVAKDMRMERVRHERSSSGDEPATDGQIRYLKWLRADIPAGLTVGQASQLIDQLKAKEQETVEVVKIPARIP